MCCLLTLNVGFVFCTTKNFHSTLSTPSRDRTQRSYPHAVGLSFSSTERQGFRARPGPRFNGDPSVCRVDVMGAETGRKDDLVKNISQIERVVKQVAMDDRPKGYE